MPTFLVENLLFSPFLLTQSRLKPSQVRKGDSIVTYGTIFWLEVSLRVTDDVLYTFIFIRLLNSPPPKYMIKVSGPPNATPPGPGPSKPMHKSTPMNWY